MWAYFVLRVMGTAVTLFVVALAVFVLLSVIPGDPARLVVGPEATVESYQAARARLQLDLPWPVRFGRWLAGTMRGDLGDSLAYNLPAGPLIARGLALTLPLACAATVVALLLAVPLGTLAATRPGGWLDLVTVGVAQLGMAIPEFWLGMLLVSLLSVRAGAFPAGGFPGWGEPGTALLHLVLPTLALALPRAAYLARMVRATVADVLSAGYVQTARAKGLTECRVLVGHALRNALIPVATTAGLALARLVAGALVIENLFYLPGVGRLALTAVRARDLPLLSGIGVTVAGLMVVVSLVVDVAYGLLDPRIRYT
ncbi:MAG: ABC transporter permease [Candidatus Bipolaricaulaceae bacterium]